MSKCKICRRLIVWVERPVKNEGDEPRFFPPFDAPDAEELKCVLDPITGRWSGYPVETEVSLTYHNCEWVPAPTLALSVSPRLEYARLLKKETPQSIDKVIKLAMRLSSTCYVCGMKPFNWCIGVQTGEPLKALHTKRSYDAN